MVELDKFDILFDRPLILDNAWVDPVQPALTALLWQAAWKVLGHVLPFGGPVSLNDTGEDSVLLGSPLAIIVVFIRADELIVSLMRLEKRLVKLLRNQSELLDTMDVDQEQKLLVLFLGPDWCFLDVIVLSLPLCGTA